ncbi:MAG: hypothetical protein HUJ51_02905 [Eggerthellaceae bacterium]|nr:hypothetical protein [Eggerthellaceae bacterium]
MFEKDVSFAINLEITGIKGQKGISLEKYVEKHEISHSEIVDIGDCVINL